MNELKIIKELYDKKKKVEKQDDCFLFDGKYLITTDTISELTHFKHEWSSPEDIAIKLIEVNVSDIAASGGYPIVAFLNLGLSKISAQDVWLKRFVKQFKKSLILYGIKLEGGDTYKSPHTNITLTLIGETKKPVFRHTGKGGEFIYLTGTIGLSNIGYHALSKTKSFPKHLEKEATKKHLRPTARLSASKELIQKYEISAMMDITDGLMQDSLKLSLASRLKFVINLNQIPNFKIYQEFISADEILTSGEELELLFLSKSKIHNLKSCTISCIGKAIRGKPQVTYLLEGRIYSPKEQGFLHF